VTCRRHVAMILCAATCGKSATSTTVWYWTYTINKTYSLLLRTNYYLLT